MSEAKAIVAMGGRSLEREISLRSGHRVERALRTLGYAVQALDVDGGFIDRVLAERPQFVFVAMHGRGGEDGTLQDLLETLAVPYTGSDPLASALCMDKMLFKRLLRLHDIPTPASTASTRPRFVSWAARARSPSCSKSSRCPLSSSPWPRARRSGSSSSRAPSSFRARSSARSATAIVCSSRSACSAASWPSPCSTRRTAQDGPRALPIVELFTPESFYSYEAHYTIGQLRMEVPAQLSEQVRARVEQVALESYALMGCRDFARVDLILDEHEVPQVLEINTIPGLTETGITTAAAEAAGMSFAELVEAIVARVVALS